MPRDNKRHKLSFTPTDEDRQLLLDEPQKFIDVLMLLHNGYSYTDVAPNPQYADRHGQKPDQSATPAPREAARKRQRIRGAGQCLNFASPAFQARSVRL